MSSPSEELSGDGVSDQSDDSDRYLVSRSSSILYDLLESGNNERTIEESLRVLNDDPDDTTAHYCIAFAYIRQDQTRKARPHVEFLLQQEPDEPDSHMAAVAYFDSLGKLKVAKKHAAEGMRIDPENSIFFYYAAVIETAQMRFKEARRFIDEALRLDPEDTDCLNLKVRLSSVDETSAEDSWRRIDELREALQLDPHDGPLHNTLGDIYLDELDSPKEAEFHYRDALKSDPKNRIYQRDLFNAVGKRDFLYRLLSIPSRTFTWIGYVIKAICKQPWRLILLLIGFKLVAAFLVWLLLATALFWPGGKIYEWLLISEIKDGAHTPMGKLRLWHSLQRVPRPMRFVIFLTVICGLYAALFLTMGIPLAPGFSFLGIAYAVHFVVVLALWLYSMSKRSHGKLKRERRKNR